MIHFLIPFLFLWIADDSMALVKEEGGNKTFWMDKHEVTIAEFEEFVNATGYKTSCEINGIGGLFSEKGENEPTPNLNWRFDPLGKKIPKERYKELPVTRVSLVDAKAYANWKGKRIPTMKEWLLAANEGSKIPKYKYSGSNIPKAVGWYEANAYEQIKPVGILKPNSLGIYDLSGNVEEITLLSENEDILIRKGGRACSDKEWMEVNEDYSMRIKTIGFNMPYLGFRCVKD